MGELRDKVASLDVDYPDYRPALQAVVDFLDPPPPPVPTEDEVAEQASQDAKDAQIADLQAQLAAAQSQTAAATQAETDEDAPVAPDQGQVTP